MQPRFARSDGTYVVRLDNGFDYHVRRDDPLFDAAAGLDWRGKGPEPALPPPPAQTLVAVLPVAFRRALRATPAPTGNAPHALAYVLGALAQPGLEDARDAFEYAVRMERADLLGLGAALGFSGAQIDAVLALAASYPGSGAVYQ